MAEDKKKHETSNQKDNAAHLSKNTGRRKRRRRSGQLLVSELKVLDSPTMDCEKELVMTNGDEAKRDTPLESKEGKRERMENKNNVRKFIDSKNDQPITGIPFVIKTASAVGNFVSSVEKEKKPTVISSDYGIKRDVPFTSQGENKNNVENVGKCNETKDKTCGDHLNVTPEKQIGKPASKNDSNDTTSAVNETEISTSFIDKNSIDNGKNFVKSQKQSAVLESKEHIFTASCDRNGGNGVQINTTKLVDIGVLDCVSEKTVQGLSPSASNTTSHNIVLSICNNKNVIVKKVVQINATLLLNVTVAKPIADNRMEELLQSAVKNKQFLGNEGIVADNKMVNVNTAKVVKVEVMESAVENTPKELFSPVGEKKTSAANIGIDKTKRNTTSSFISMETKVDEDSVGNSEKIIKMNVTKLVKLEPTPEELSLPAISSADSEQTKQNLLVNCSPKKKTGDSVKNIKNGKKYDEMNITKVVDNPVVEPTVIVTNNPESVLDDVNKSTSTSIGCNEMKRDVLFVSNGNKNVSSSIKDGRSSNELKKPDASSTSKKRNEVSNIEKRNIVNYEERIKVDNKNVFSDTTTTSNKLEYIDDDSEWIVASSSKRRKRAGNIVERHATIEENGKPINIEKVFGTYQILEGCERPPIKEKKSNCTEDSTKVKQGAPVSIYKKSNKQNTINFKKYDKHGKVSPSLERRTNAVTKKNKSVTVNEISVETQNMPPASNEMKKASDIKKTNNKSENKYVKTKVEDKIPSTTIGERIVHHIIKNSSETLQDIRASVSKKRSKLEKIKKKDITFEKCVEVNKNESVCDAVFYSESTSNTDKPKSVSGKNNVLPENNESDMGKKITGKNKKFTEQSIQCNKKINNSVGEKILTTKSSANKESTSSASSAFPEKKLIIFNDDGNEIKQCMESAVLKKLRKRGKGKTVDIDLKCDKMKKGEVLEHGTNIVTEELISPLVEQNEPVNVGKNYNRQKSACVSRQNNKEDVNIVKKIETDEKHITVVDEVLECDKSNTNKCVDDTVLEFSTGAITEEFISPLVEQNEPVNVGKNYNRQKSACVSRRNNKKDVNIVKKIETDEKHITVVDEVLECDKSNTNKCVDDTVLEFSTGAITEEFISPLVEQNEPVNVGKNYNRQKSACVSRRNNKKDVNIVKKIETDEKHITVVDEVLECDKSNTNKCVDDTVLEFSTGAITKEFISPLVEQNEPVNVGKNYNRQKSACVSRPNNKKDVNIVKKIETDEKHITVVDEVLECDKSNTNKCVDDTVLEFSTGAITEELISPLLKNKHDNAGTHSNEKRDVLLTNKNEKISVHNLKNTEKDEKHKKIKNGKSVVQHKTDITDVKKFVSPPVKNRTPDDLCNVGDGIKSDVISSKRVVTKKSTNEKEYINVNGSIPICANTALETVADIDIQLLPTLSPSPIKNNNLSENGDAVKKDISSSSKKDKHLHREEDIENGKEYAKLINLKSDSDEIMLEPTVNSSISEVFTSVEGNNHAYIQNSSDVISNRRTRINSKEKVEYRKTNVESITVNSVESKKNISGSDIKDIKHELENISNVFKKIKYKASQFGLTESLMDTENMSESTKWKQFLKLTRSWSVNIWHADVFDSLDTEKNEPSNVELFAIIEDFFRNSTKSTAELSAAESLVDTRDVIYQSLAFVRDKFPDWLSENNGKILESKYGNYIKLYGIVSDVCASYEMKEELATFLNHLNKFIAQASVQSIPHEISQLMYERISYRRFVRKKYNNVVNTNAALGSAKIVENEETVVSDVKSASHQNGCIPSIKEETAAGNKEILVFENIKTDVSHCCIASEKHEISKDNEETSKFENMNKVEETDLLKKKCNGAMSTWETNAILGSVKIVEGKKTIVDNIELRSSQNDCIPRLEETMCENYEEISQIPKMEEKKSEDNEEITQISRVEEKRSEDDEEIPQLIEVSQAEAANPWIFTKNSSNLLGTQFTEYIPVWIQEIMRENDDLLNITEVAQNNNAVMQSIVKQFFEKNPAINTKSDSEKKSVVDKIVETLLSKEAVYAPFAVARDKFPAWLTENTDKISTSQFIHHTKQYECIKELCALYEMEERPENFSEQREQLITRIVHMGNLPEEINQLLPQSAINSNLLAEMCNDIDISTVCRIM